MSTEYLEQQLVSEELAAEDDFQPSPTQPSPTEASIDDRMIRQLSLLLRCLYAFFKIKNHPLTETEEAEIWTRNFVNETRIAREILLRATRLTLGCAPQGENTNFVGIDNHAVISLAEMLTEAATLCETIIDAPQVSFDAFTSLGNMITRQLDQASAAINLRRVYTDYNLDDLQPTLRTVIDGMDSEQTMTDVRRIFIDLARLNDYMHWMEDDLRADRPLKQTLALFTLLHDEAQTLREHIEKRALRAVDAGSDVFEVLDSIGYALNMELRKVFGYELIGLSALRQAPIIYVKVEQSYGLLSNCFQQSTVTLAQSFDRTIQGAELFQTFQTRLDQSLALCRDLYELLKFIRRAAGERDRYPVSSYKARLKAFREGSLRYLMYKDWDTYERFAEEIGATTGAVELAPVLHRFDCYLETLLNQIKMRAVLADQPLEFLGAQQTPL